MKALIPKRAFVSVLLSLLVLLLCACGAAQTAPAAETAVPEPTEEPVPEELTLGPLTITPETKSISLDGTGVALEELMALSGRIDGVESISLGIPAGNLPQLYAVRDAFPNARVSWQAELPGQTVDNTAEELDLTAAQDGDLKTITDALAILPNVRTIQLAPEDGATQLSFESLAAIAAAAPEAELNCRFELFGQTADWTTQELRYEKTPIGDEGIAAFRAALPYLRSLTLLRFKQCDIADYDAMAALRADFPEKNVVWSIDIAGYPFMTDTTLINDGDTNLLHDGNVDLLRYMPDVLYLDIGHNHHLTNIEFVRNFPKLQVMILTLTNIADITPLENCPDLEFLECHSCQIGDLSPLADKEKLEYLNIANLPNVTDLPPLYGLKGLKIVRICGTTFTHITQADVDVLKEKLPDTFVSDYGGDPNSSGQWRYNTNGNKADPTERYALLRQQMLYDLNWEQRLSNSPSGEEG